MYRITSARETVSPAGAPAGKFVIPAAPANILAISVAFLTYKMFVFKTQGNWVSEYMKCYLVYGGTAVLGTILIWVFVDFFKWPFWISQGIVMTITMVVSYSIHRIFTFVHFSKTHD